MTTVLMWTAVLVVGGTLATGLDALTGGSRPLCIVIGRLLWCAAGTLAVMEVSIAAIRLIVGDSQRVAIASPTLQLISGLFVAAAAILLLHLHGGLPGTQNRSAATGQDEDVSDNHFQ